MKGFAIFLTILLCLLVGTAVTLLVLIISVSRKITRTQANVRTLSQRVAEITDTLTAASSLVALFGSVSARYKARGKSKKQKS